MTLSFAAGVKDVAHTDLEFVDEVIALHEFIADIFECMTFSCFVDSEHIKRPVIQTLQYRDHILKSTDM